MCALVKNCVLKKYHFYLKKFGAIIQIRRIHTFQEEKFDFEFSKKSWNHSRQFFWFYLNTIVCHKDIIFSRKSRKLPPYSRVLYQRSVKIRYFVTSTVCLRSSYVCTYAKIVTFLMWPVIWPLGNLSSF